MTGPSQFLCSQYGARNAVTSKKLSSGVLPSCVINITNVLFLYDEILEGYIVVHLPKVNYSYVLAMYVCMVCTYIADDLLSPIVQKVICTNMFSLHLIFLYNDYALTAKVNASYVCTYIYTQHMYINISYILVFEEF